MSDSRSLKDLRGPPTYKRLLQVPSNGIDGTLRDICDGEGDITPLRLSTDAAEVTVLPTTDNGIANKSYVDSTVSTFRIFPEDFGAVADGTDSTTALIAAIASAASQGYMLDGRGRTYTISDNLILTPNVQHWWHNITIQVSGTPASTNIIQHINAAPTLIGTITVNAAFEADTLVLTSVDGLAVNDAILISSDDNMTGVTATFSRAAEVSRVRTIDPVTKTITLYTRLRRPLTVVSNGRVFKLTQSGNVRWENVRIIGRGPGFNERGFFCTYSWKNYYRNCRFEGFEQASLAENVTFFTTGDNWHFEGTRTPQRGYGISHSGCYGASYGSLFGLRLRHAITGSRAGAEFNRWCGRDVAFGDVISLEALGAPVDTHPGACPTTVGDVLCEMHEDVDTSSPGVICQGGGIKVGHVTIINGTTGGLCIQSYGWRDGVYFEPTLEALSINGANCRGSMIVARNESGREDSSKAQLGRIKVAFASGYWERGIVAHGEHGDVEIDVYGADYSSSSSTIWARGYADGRAVLNLRNVRAVHRAARATPIIALGSEYWAVTGQPGAIINMDGGSYTAPQKDIYVEQAIVNLRYVTEPANPVTQLVGSAAQVNRINLAGRDGAFTADPTGLDLLGTGATLRINGFPVLGLPQVGFVAMAGTAAPDASGINADTITATDSNIQALAAYTKAIGDALMAHGLARFTLTLPPVNTVLPSITGTPSVGSVLTCSTGTWSNSPTGYTYQWLQNGAAIGGATSSTYTQVSGDEGETLTCAVTASNAGGSASVVTGPVYTGRPFVTVAPVITSSSLYVGTVFTCSTGTWGNSPTSYAYQWFANGTAITGATSSSYTSQTIDDGATLTCAVTATNAVGAVTATTASVGPIELGWSPRNITNIKAWLCADDLADGAVTTWVDRILGISPTQATSSARPTKSATSFNGVAGVTFDGVDDNLSVAVPATFPIGADEGWIWASCSQDATAVPGPVTVRNLVSYGTSTSGNGRLLQRAELSTTPGFRITLNAANTLTHTATDFSGVHIVGGRFLATENQGRIDGQQTAPIRATGTTMDTLNTRAFRVGAGQGTSVGTSVWQGQIRNIVVTGVMTDDEATRLEAYLAWDCGREDLLPEDHPWKFIPPWVIS